MGNCKDIGISLLGNNALSCLDINDQVAILPSKEFVHRFNSDSYFIRNNHSNTAIQINSNRTSFIYISANNTTIIQGVSGWRCNISTYDTPVCNKPIPTGLTIYTNSGYSIAHTGIRPVTNHYYENLIKGLGDYYSDEIYEARLIGILTDNQFSLSEKIEATILLAKRSSLSSFDPLISWLKHEDNSTLAPYIIYALKTIIERQLKINKENIIDKKLIFQKILVQIITSNKEGNRATRKAAVDALTDLYSPDQISNICALLIKDPDPIIALLAVKGLDDTISNDTFISLLALLDYLIAHNCEPSGLKLIEDFYVRVANEHRSKIVKQIIDISGDNKRFQKALMRLFLKKPSRIRTATIRDWLAHRDASVRALTIEAITQETIIDYNFLNTLAKDDSVEVRAALPAIAAIIDKPFVDAILLQLAEDNSIIVREAVARVISKRQNEITKNILLALLYDSSEKVRYAAIKSLFKFKSKDLLPYMKRIIEAGFVSNANPDIASAMLYDYAQLPFTEVVEDIFNWFFDLNLSQIWREHLAVIILQIEIEHRTDKALSKLQYMAKKGDLLAKQVLINWGIVKAETSGKQNLFLLNSFIEELLKERLGTHYSKLSYEVRNSIFILLLHLTFSAQFRNNLGIWLEKDNADKSTEYGGNFCFNGKELKLNILPPSKWGSDFEYHMPISIISLSNCLFDGLHFHALEGAASYLAPSILESHGEILGDMSETNQILVTRIKKGKFNIKWYDRHIESIDLGNFTYNADKSCN